MNPYYQQGYDAYFDQNPTNPHKRFTSEWTQWNSGFHTADNDAEKWEEKRREVKEY